MMFIAISLFFFGVSAAKDQDSTTVVVNTSSGTLIGAKRLVLNTEINVFLGVPYAMPPLGNLRFKPPVPLLEENIIETQDFGPICYQPPHAISAISPLLGPNGVNMSEDCLYINIYVPERKNEEQIPVMIWFPGEGFNYADPTQFDGSILAVKNGVIVVTISYRVSVFGFFSALSNDAPGNVGLLDQRLALKWVQKNIEAFGGDSNKVTLFGRFTGAMSVAIHAFSPLSKNETLFQRIILHSGVPHGKWIFNSNPLKAAISLAEKSNCESDYLNETIACLKRLPADVLLNTALPIPNAWRPSLDFSLINKPTLSEAVKGDYLPIDIMIGTNNNEGSLCLTVLNVLRSKHYEPIITDTLSKEAADQLLQSFTQDVSKESNEFVNKLVSYTYGAYHKSTLRQNFVKFCGDIYVYSHTGKLAEIISQKKIENIFVYELSHRPSFSNQPSFIEAGHGDDVLYAFGLPFKIENLPDEENELTLKIMKAFRNFAYNGNPNNVNETDWPAYTNDSRLIRRFDSNPDTEDILKTEHEDAVEFWHDVIPNAFSHICPPEPVTSALVDVQENKSEINAHFFGTWISIPAAEYLLSGLVYVSGILLISVALALVVILRYSSSMAFERLK